MAFPTEPVNGGLPTGPASTPIVRTDRDAALTGWAVAVRGSAIDVRFPAGLPAVSHRLEAG